jgi:hypothetical protein
MKHILKIMLAMLFIFSNVHAKYVCTTDQTFQDWLGQKPVDVTDDLALVKYSDLTSCKSQCKKTANCVTISTDDSRVISPLATSYTEGEKNNLISLVSGKNITSLKINDGAATVTAELLNFNGSSFTFPSGNAASGTLSNSVYNSGGTSITTYKLYPDVYVDEAMKTATAITVADTSVFKTKVNDRIINSNGVVGFVINGDRLIFNTSLSADGFKWETSAGTKTVFSDGGYGVKLVTTDSNGTKKYTIEYSFAGVTKHAFKSGELDSLSLIYKKKDTNVAYRVKIVIGSDMLEQSSSWTSDAAGQVYQNKTIGLEAIFALNGFTCPLFDSNTDLNGDIGLNAFSTTGSCTNECYQQNSCIAWTDDPRCSPTSYDKANPVSDYTGKTVFTKYNIAWNCKSSEILHGECLAYSTERIDDNTSFDISRVGWKSKAFTGPDEAMTAVAGMEQFQHIWSGWNGMCEKGTVFDDAWMSDPMTLLSFAMMAYTGALEGGYGTTMQDAATSATKSVTDNFDKLTTFGDSAASGGGGALGSAGTVNPPDPSTATSVWDDIGNFKDTKLIDATSMSRAVTYGSVVMDAAMMAQAALSEPTGDDLKTADDYMKAQFGGTDASVAAVNYTQCMASIGLSFPNMVGFAVDSNTSMSSELREPWKNIITLSDNQLAELMKATSEKFVRGSLLLKDHDSNSGIGHYIATTSLAYTQAGQVICGNGKIAKAININNQIASDNSGGGMNTDAMAMSAVSSALSYLPPPYNLIASIALKMLTSVSEGNACSDEDIAMKWGIQQFKTNKALKFKQCHATDSECAAKWFWGDCMRDRYFHCCYDQEMTRIFVEGVKAQIPKSWNKNECDDISLTDLKNISFRKCLDEEDAATDKCFPQVSWLALNDAIKKQTVKGFDASTLTNMAVDAMPIGDDPWGSRVGD